MIGTAANAGSICGDGKEEGQLGVDCRNQPLVAALHRKGGVWSGSLTYFIVRRSDGGRFYKHAVVETIQVRPAR